MVGEYVADLTVEDSIIGEVKSARAIDEAHAAQCINYLAATKLPICMLLNFSTRVQIKRIVGPTAPQFPRTRLGPSGPSAAS